MTSVTERRGLARVLMERMNACVSCGRPLMWDDGQCEKDCADDRFKLLHQAITLRKTNCFGNAEVSRKSFHMCHLVHMSYVPHFGPSDLYQTPINGTVEADRRLLLFSGNPLMKWTEEEIKQLCPEIKTTRMTKMHEQMAIKTQQTWLGCVDCNREHTCIMGLNNLFKNQHTQFDRLTMNTDRIFYTLIFNCMAYDSTNNGTTINIKKHKRETWLFQLWLNYTCILFLALMQKEIQNKDKFYMAHIHMGLADWIMTQILASMLYTQYDISIGLVDLHQYYMSNIMHWVKNNRSRPNDKDPRCLWKWVLGKDTNVGKERDEEASHYFMIGNVTVQAKYLHDSLLNFNQHWIKQIGECLTNQKPDKTLNTFFIEIRDQIQFMRSKLPFTQFDNDIVENVFFSQHRLIDLENAVKALQPPSESIPQSNIITIYKNFIRNTFARFMYYREEGNQDHTAIINSFCHFLYR